MEAAMEIPASPRPNLRAQAKAATRQKVLDSATRLFEADGYAAATIRDIAKGAGMSTGAVFANFEDKVALYRTIYDHKPITPEAGHQLFLATRQMMADLRSDPSWGDMAERHPNVMAINDAMDSIEGNHG